MADFELGDLIGDQIEKVLQFQVSSWLTFILVFTVDGSLFIKVYFFILILFRSTNFSNNYFSSGFNGN